VAELMRAVPSEAVVAWLRDRHHDAERLFTTSVTVAEIAYGIERLPRGRRKDKLKAAARDLFGSFGDQILAFDVAAAAVYATIVAARDKAGLSISGFDAQIAAVCRCHNATLATRNMKDFRRTGVELFDPWQYR
jgi:hypothetical protein